MERTQKCKACATPYVCPKTIRKTKLLVLHNWRCENEMCRRLLPLESDIKQRLRRWELSHISTICIEFSMYDIPSYSKVKPIIAEFDRASGNFGMASHDQPDLTDTSYTVLHLNSESADYVNA